jgi:hypothetical protein
VNRREIAGPNAIDPWTNGINIFDLNNMAWESNYDPKAPACKTPSVITEDFQNAGSLPRSWSYPQLHQLFAVVFHPRSSSPSPTSSASATASSSPHRSHTGATITGVVGGIAGLMCITLLVGWFVLRHRRKQQRRDRGRSANDKPELPPW